ncbi:uncharacterized protein BJX67DRAFT_266376 [Aspergillus lucknowensis]|uniref:Uncharacterized protein n=1 Tax=Aspergillus lucknowensis TaxID=176173 RepID=A0ABR4LF49_9EURO
MPLLQSWKHATRGVVSCCDRQKGSKFETQYPKHGFSPTATASRSKRPFAQLKWWPNTRNDGRERDLRTAPSRQQREDKFTDRNSNSKPEDITRKIFTYDMMVFGLAEDVVYRRVLLEFGVNIDAVSDEIPHLLGIPIDPYDGFEVRLPNGLYVEPIGTVETTWKLYTGQRSHRTRFLVIEDSQFDMLIGRSSIQQYRLWEEDADIWKRLQYHSEKDHLGPG